MSNDIIHLKIIIKGTVQGVGFRPHVYNLAMLHGLKGTVLNSPQGVVVDVEGKQYSVDIFISDLKSHPPPLARINSFDISDHPLNNYQSFAILNSSGEYAAEALIPPDVATCHECRYDVSNPRDNHYQYPFTNCTNCGPRFSIINTIPYDRPNTSMSAFAMCESCRNEYIDPSNRRFHAQPVACPLCGPQLFITDSNGSIVAEHDAWLTSAWEILKDGKILAIKGLGGFHLACDARNNHAIKLLRERKGRKDKPFAIMCRNVETAKLFCNINYVEAEKLESEGAPIVLLQKNNECSLPEDLSPNLHSLGVILPYTPLHLMLFSGPFDVLVMTSGNYSGLPLVKDNDAACVELGRIADFFLLHNRDIVNRCDDSVLQIIDNETHFFRRSRGYVPRPISIKRDASSPTILGVGGEMKNAFCLLKGNQAFMSQYIGEIDSVEGEENLLSSLLNFQSLIGAEPDIIAFDAHPDYASASIAQKIQSDTYEKVYHHHAHLAGVMAENALNNENIIGIILDGTGFGADQCFWGFEILLGNYVDFKRLYHLAYIPLPGGEASIRHPWRTAISYLVTFLGDKGKECGRMLFRNKDVQVVEEMVTKGFNAPLACGCGRLFDAVSAIIGVCSETTYEGQAAIELGELLLPESNYEPYNPYSYSIHGDTITPKGFIDGVVNDCLAGLSVHAISKRFHDTIVAIISECVVNAKKETGLNRVALSGGTFQNRYLLKEVKKVLSERGFDILYHRHVPANDGGISLGQAMVAHWRWKLKNSEE